MSHSSDHLDYNLDILVVFWLMENNKIFEKVLELMINFITFAVVYNIHWPSILTFLYWTLEWLWCLRFSGSFQCSMIPIPNETDDDAKIFNGFQLKMIVILRKLLCKGYQCFIFLIIWWYICTFQKCNRYGCNGMMDHQFSLNDNRMCF